MNLAPLLPWSHCLMKFHQHLLPLAIVLTFAACDRPEEDPAAPNPKASLIAQELAPLLKTEQRDGRIPGQYIVIFHDDVQGDAVHARAEELAAAARGQIKRVLPIGLTGFVLTVDDEKALEDVRRHPAVRYVEQDTREVPLATQTNAPWSLARIDQTFGPPDTDYVYDYDGSG